MFSSISIPLIHRTLLPSYYNPIIFNFQFLTASFSPLNPPQAEKAMQAGLISNFQLLTPQSPSSFHSFRKKRGNTSALPLPDSGYTFP